MRKGLFVLLSLALVVALAVPASAEMKLTGFYRVKPTVSNFLGAGNTQLNVPGDAAGALNKAATETSTNFTEMRNRLRFEIGDENVKGITFFEIDGNFGDVGGSIGRNQGFANNGDSINIETKNVYVWFKIPDTTVTFQVGLQNYTDEFAGLLFGASDQAGVVMGAKFEPVTLRLTWIKLRDNVSFTGADPVQQWASSNPGDKSADYYAIDAKFGPTKEVNVTGHFAFLRDSQSAIVEPTEVPAATADKLKAYYVGANATINVAPATLTAFFLYNFGTFERTAGNADVDISGYAGSVRADLQLGPGNAFIEGLYVSGDNSPNDTKYKSVITGSDYANLTSFYVRPDLIILFPNADMINSAKGLVFNPNNSGRGLILGAAGFSMKLADKVSGKVGLGYLTADKKRGTGNDKSMATEVNANVNYNISKGLDFGLYGAYAFLGGFYDVPAPGASPDDLYAFYGRLNYAF